MLFFKTDYCLMQVKSIAECSKRAFCNTFDLIKLPFVFKTFVLSIFEWPFKTGFTVHYLQFVKIKTIMAEWSLYEECNNKTMYREYDPK